ncbi:MAG TPA: hypothetical protein DEP84_05125 [Chloroflexi bacterium]|nr:hypothetical protein [Chloroflexota bacterium]
MSPTPGILQVPLLIQEALPDDPAQADFQLLPGLDRSQEPVTVGLPLPEDAGVSNVTQLGLSGASAGQFRVLARWPNGNVKWILVDTLADVSAGTQTRGISLTGGFGSFGGPNLAADRGTTIAVNTGPAQFTIRKQGFNLFDAVTVNGVAVVAPGASPGVELIGTDGSIFRAANDANVQVSIEENGPVRAVVLAKGTHYSAGGQRNLDFTVRMHFYKGKSRVTVFYTLRNASKEQVENAAFRSLELVVASTISQPQFVLGNHTGQTTGALSPGSAVRLFQGENAFPNVRDYDFECCWPTTISGYTISRDGQVLASDTRDQFIDLFYAQARAGDGRGVTIGTRFAAGWWPQGLGIDGDGMLRVGLFPPGNDRPYYARFFGHVTREVLFDFASAAPNPRDTFFRFQYPLVAKAADVEWYNRSGALWEKIVSFADEAAYYQSHGWPVANDQYATLNRRPEFRIWRHQYWGAGGGLNQYDFTKVDVHNFLRQGALFGGGYFLDAEQRLAYNADLASYHSDDFHAAQVASEVPELYDPVSDGVRGFEELPNGDKVPQAKAIFEGEHRHASGMALWYYLSGDERFRETYTDWGEYMQTQANWNGWERGLAWNIYNLVDLYRFTGEPVYHDLAWQSLRQEVLDKAAVYRQSAGTDWRRGFFVSESDASEPERSMAAFIKGAMFPRSYAYFHDFAAANRLEADRARDVLEGMVRFVAYELWFEYGQNPGDFGFPYRISADSPPPADVRTMDEWYGGLKEAYLTFVYGYLLTGDREFLRRGELLQKATAYDTPGGYWFQDLPDRQTLQHLLQHTGEYAVWRDLPVSVRNNGGGAYTLSWTVPAGARQYWIKYADKPIVPWLNFDRYTRQYQYDPNQYVPFFAAQNVADEPTPGQPGATETYSISGLDPGKMYNFAVRYEADSD